MEKITEKMESIVARAEADLLEVVADAAAVGDYESLDAARDLAGRLFALRKALSADSAKPTVQAESASPNSRTTRRKGGERTSRKRVAKGGAAGYPKYRVEDGCLYKIAWSKKKKSEYTHRLPLVNMSRFLDVLDGQHASGMPLVTELCLQSAADQPDALPAYQFYIVLGLLKMLEAAHPVGREGFSLDANWRSSVDRFIRQQSVEDTGASK